MKILQTLAIAALAVVFAATTSAQTVIRITGSNGDRTATQTAISKLLAPGWVFQGVNGNTSSAGTLSVATDANFGAWNGTYAGSPVIIKVSFSGALAGIAAVAGNTDQRYVATNGTGTGAVPNPLTATNPADFEVNKADFGFSTNFQSTSPYSGTFQGVTYNTVIEEVVGVSPLGFYGSPGFPGTPSSTNPSFVPNITTQLAQLLYSTGSVSLALFTGDFTNDLNKRVFAIGRNTDAGQRFGAVTEIGFGTQTSVVHWLPVYGTGGQAPTTSGTITYGGVVVSHGIWPAETIGGILSPGSSGFNSGALLAQRLTATLSAAAYKGEYFDQDTGTNQFLFPNATAGYYVGYVTPGDAANRILGGNGVVPVANRGIALTYNGVALTNANVQSGRYTAWVYNRILKPQTGLVGFKLTFANALRDQIKNVDAPAGGGLFDDANFKVQRFTDGGLVVPK